MAEDPTGERERAASSLAEASARVVRTVDGFHGADWAAPSLLPDWTRAHVVAHLALNAEGMTDLLRGLAPTMYASDEQRGRDIADLASAEPRAIRDRLLAGVTLLQESLEDVPDDAWETRVERTPGGRTMRLAALPGMRWRELEIHHVDLDAGSTPADWTADFAEHLVDAMAKRLRPQQAFEVRPHDSPRTWVFGPAEAEYPVPVVTGAGADLAWWLTGRPPGDRLSGSGGELPVIEGW
jgi:maleylpyruvate isomerase